MKTQGWKLVAIVSVALFAGTSCGGGTSADNSCSTNDDCIDGYLCFQDLCQMLEPVHITTDALPDATVGAAYNVQMQAEGGVKPYRWSFTQKPGWMSIHPETGRITGTPSQAAASVQVVVRVEDSTTGRDSYDENTYNIKVGTCTEGEQIDCWITQQGKCMAGKQTCTDGQLGNCEGTDFSTDFDHCGENCEPCDPTKADACDAGECVCGQSSACPGKEICCDSNCVDGTVDGNCGECGRNCSELLANSANPRCEDGICTSDGCLPGFADCDSDVLNGCEAELGPANCGGCGIDCTVQMQHVADPQCINTQDGWMCEYTGAGVNGEGCETGWLDCDGDRTNGCETEVTNENCGGCGIECQATCELAPEGDRYVCSCQQDSECGTSGLCCDNECVSVDDPAHCGSCSNDCTATVQNAQAICASGTCTHGPCSSGYLDCDSDLANGCERAFDDQNCGACGFSCGPNASCDTSTGSCTCNDGFANCDGDWSNGCEVNITTDAANCGMCNHDCTDDLQNATGPLCSGGQCDYTACNALFLDCDGDRTNGCELPMDDDNCGSCGFACGAHAICDAGSCACLQGWGNCVDGWADGCETDLSSTVDHCGNCSTNCNSLNNVADVSCIDGNCRINSCDAQYGNCDGVTENGCEEDLWVTDSCGTTCANRVDCNAEIEHGNGVFCNQGSCDYTDCGYCLAFAIDCFRDCDGDRSNGCETDIYVDTACRATCTDTPTNCLTSVENANNPACRGGKCKYDSCFPNYGDCDGDTANGCETDLTSVYSCGTDCQNRTNCTTHVQHASGIECNNNACNYQSCDSCYANCDNDRTNGCERYVCSDTNCGCAGYNCTNRPHTTGGTCQNGVCILQCSPGWRDCNFRVDDGCEYYGTFCP